MMVLLKHCKHIKMFLSSGERLLALDYKVGIVLRAYCCVKLALLEDNSMFRRVVCPNEPLPETVYVIHSALRIRCSIILLIIY